jgi:multiple sugar transport system permease protein
MVVGTAVALLLHNSPHRKLFLPALLLPIVATPIVVGFIFKYMYQEDYGLISYFMKLTHLFPGFNLTSRIHTVLPALAFVDFWEWTPFVMLIMLAGFNGIPLSVTEAANLDGASGWKRLWFVELPMLRAEFLVALLFRTVDIIRVYDIIYATTRGGPGAFSESASVYLQTTAFKFRDLGYACAFGFTLVLLGVALANFYLRLARARGQEPA